METESTKKTSPAPLLTEFMFAGGGQYTPVTIKAASIAEATAIWEKTRVAVGTSETLSTKK
jgi:hypothetical protein